MDLRVTPMTMNSTRMLSSTDAVDSVAHWSTPARAWIIDLRIAVESTGREIMIGVVGDQCQRCPALGSARNRIVESQRAWRRVESGPQPSCSFLIAGLDVRNLAYQEETAVRDTRVCSLSRVSSGQAFSAR